MSTLNVLLAGRASAEVEELRILVSKLPGVQVTTRVATNGHMDPLYGITAMPDVLVLTLSAHAEEELRALIARPANDRPATIVIGKSVEDAGIMRLAMQAGARDFYRLPVPETELLSTLRQIARERSSRQTGRQSRMTAVIDAKGGAGASIVACNVAHVIATQTGLRTVLMDMDLQFGTQMLNLDLRPEHSILDLLSSVETLDVVGMSAFLTEHKSGLLLLSGNADQITLPGEVSIPRLTQLLDLMLTGFDHIVVDLPRLVDPVMTTIAERANQILICMEQNLANLRDVQRLVRILKQDLEIPGERLTVVINRHQDDASVSQQDIKEALQGASVFCVPNDYKRVNAALNLGAPLVEYASGTPVMKALSKLAVGLSGVEEQSKKGLLGRLFSRISVGA
jgi:pilus assembly protein CpaE